MTGKSYRSDRIDRQGLGFEYDKHCIQCDGAIPSCQETVVEQAGYGESAIGLWDGFICSACLESLNWWILHPWLDLANELTGEAYP